MEQKINDESLISDETGFETLDNIALANRLNHWMFNVISADLKGEILEIGSGIGNISEFVIHKNYRIALSDLRIEYCNFLQKKYSKKENVTGVYQLDITDPEFDKKYADLFGKFDTVFALNIVEHTDDDGNTIKNCLKLLNNKGTLIILVPAFMGLFNTFDEGLGHYRRYTKKKLNQLFIQNDIQIVKSRYFNFAGILGWWISGSVLKNKTIPKKHLKIYNSLVWLFKIVDFFTRSFLGLSVITTGIKIKK